MAGNMPPQWLGLLRWSLKYKDGTSDSKLRPMSDEDKTFLENVMKNLVIDENEQIRMGITTLKMGAKEKATSSSDAGKTTIDKDATSGVVEAENRDAISELEALDREESEKDEITRKKEEVLEMLDDIVINGDNAHNFCKMGGIPSLLSCIKSEQNSLVQKALHFVATLTQNNKVVQIEYLKAGGLQPLFTILKTSSNGDLIAKAIGAISATIRGCKAGETAFKKAQGLPFLLKMLDDKKMENSLPSAAVRKSIALISHFMGLDKANVTLLVALGAPRIILGKIGDKDLDVRERALGILLEILEEKDNTAAKAKTALLSVDVANLIEQRMKMVEGAIREGDEDDKEMYSVELDSLRSLDDLLNK
eukprot:CAMPEP_0184478316 /NCGR_PEP_ID=MMETSP0113_2-20130426/378_1 /TAXON_ID=91329 /ORGANISM="Norrisiella sphaerica, Strain BC52" /LENGTH=363 /DNA_ID=CAMNT_0026856067 /DNA_START=32 /DNA_END=1123 /DNA_ORIENTATION=-